MSSPRRDTIDPDFSHSGSDKKERVDLGLALLGALIKPGQTLTRYDIATWCGCTDAAIYMLERRALKKIANRIRFGRGALRRNDVEIR